MAVSVKNVTYTTDAIYNLMKANKIYHADQKQCYKKNQHKL